MKPHHIQVHGDENHSFRVFTKEVPFHHKPYHYHKELEIVYVLKGSGTRFIGDNVEPFGVDDLVLIGENLPHCWKDDPVYFESSDLLAQSYIVQFSKDFAGSLFDMVEFKQIRSLLTDAKKGLKFHDSVKPAIKAKLEELAKYQGWKRVLTLVETLQMMAVTDQKCVLNPTLTNDQNQESLDRLNAVFEYSIRHVAKKVSLKEISAVANLSPNAFCRYFKQHTRKSYTDFMNDLRISKVCKMMHETNDLNISEMAYSNGFNNLAHFTNTFKKLKGMTPLQYKKNVKYEPLNSIGNQ